MLRNTTSDCQREVTIYFTLCANVCIILFRNYLTVMALGDGGRGVKRTKLPVNLVGCSRDVDDLFTMLLP